MSDVSTGMPRPKSDNDQQIAIRVPRDLLTRANDLIAFVAPPGITITRADVLRVALMRGIAAIEADANANDAKSRAQRSKTPASDALRLQQRVRATKSPKI